jgi:hypothetical protein
MLMIEWFKLLQCWAKLNIRVQHTRPLIALTDAPIIALPFRPALHSSTSRHAVHLISANTPPCAASAPPLPLTPTGREMSPLPFLYLTPAFRPVLRRSHRQGCLLRGGWRAAPHAQKYRMCGCRAAEVKASVAGGAGYGTQRRSSWQFGRGWRPCRCCRGFRLTGCKATAFSTCSSCVR